MGYLMHDFQTMGYGGRDYHSFCMSDHEGGLLPLSLSVLQFGQVTPPPQFTLYLNLSSPFNFTLFDFIKQLYLTTKICERKNMIQGEKNTKAGKKISHASQPQLILPSKQCDAFQIKRPLCRKIEMIPRGAVSMAAAPGYFNKDALVTLLAGSFQRPYIREMMHSALNL